MSHTMNINLQITDLDALQAVAERLNLDIEKEQHGDQTFYYLYPKGNRIGTWMAINLKTGVATVDTDYWTTQKVNEVKAYWGIEKAKIDARMEGHSVIETWNDQTQELELEIEVGGAA